MEDRHGETGLVRVGLTVDSPVMGHEQNQHPAIHILVLVRTSEWSLTVCVPSPDYVPDAVVLCLLFSSFPACCFFMKQALNLHDHLQIIQSCALQIVDGTWSEWSAWGFCSVTCNAGLQWRNRSCDGTKYGGDDCAGAANESRVCSTGPCPGTPGTRHGQVYSSTRHMHSSL